MKAIELKGKTMFRVIPSTWETADPETLGRQYEDFRRWFNANEEHFDIYDETPWEVLEDWTRFMQEHVKGE